MDFINIIGTLFDNSIEHVVALAHLIKDLRLNKNLQDINEDVYNKLSDSNSRIDLIELNLEEINQNLNEFEEQASSKFDDINTSLEKVNQDNSDILENIAEVNQNIENLNQDVEDINQSLDENELTNLNLQNKIDALVSENRRINGIIDNIKANEFKHIILTQALYDALQSYLRNAIYLIVEKEISNYSVFGDTFPFILGGTFSRFGDTFPFTLGGVSSKFGEPFPIILD